MKGKSFTLYCMIWSILLIGLFSQVCFGIANPVGYWALNAGSGTSCVDSSGNGNTGTISGTASWVAVNGGYCLYFNGTNSYVNCGTGSTLNITGSIFSMSAWVCPDSVQPYEEPGICGKGTNSYLMTFYKDGRIWSYVYSTGNTNPNSANAGILPGQWFHIAMTYDGSYLREYINGQLAGMRAYTGSLASGSNFCIGRNGVGGSLFKGYIDDVKVWNSTLSASDVATLFTTTERNTRNGMSALGGTYSAVTASQTLTSGNLTVKVGNKGGIQITKGTSPNTSSVVWDSRYSYPGTSIGYNWLSQTQTIHWPTPTVTKNGSTITISANDSGHYTLSRTVKINNLNGNDRVEIQDTITNTSGSPIGILIRHQLTSSSSMSNNVYGTEAACPLVFWTQTNADFGVVCEDDIGRLNWSATAVNNLCKIEHNYFGLASSSPTSHVFKYAVYPKTTTGDVFDVVNLVRKDWSSNFAIDGPGRFVDYYDTDVPFYSQDLLTKWIQRRNLNVAILSPWLDYDPGTPTDHILSRSDYQSVMTAAASKLHAANPNLKALGSVETDWVDINPDNHIDNTKPMFTQADGDAIKAWCSGTGSQAALDTAIANTVAAGNLRWRDPLTLTYYNFADSIKRFSGQHVKIEYYDRGGQHFYALNVYPWKGGSYSEQYNFLMNQNAFIMDTCGLDGFYEDEFSMAWGSVPNFSYGVTGEPGWDGLSVIINPTTGAITDQVVSCSWMGIQPRVDIINAASSRSKCIVNNTYSTSPQEQSLPAWRFSETQGTVVPDAQTVGYEPTFDAYLFESALGSPIGLGAANPVAMTDTSQGLMLSMMKFLRHGMVYYHYQYPELPTSGNGAGEYGPINHMFPITPQELHKGWIKGNERIVTCVSLSNISWNNSTSYPIIHFFDMHGYETSARNRTYSITGTPGNWTVSVTLTNWSEFAVIEGSSTGMVAFYNFSEGAGNVAIDRSVNQNTANIYGGASWPTVNGGNCTYFDGYKNYIDCGSSGLLDLKQGVTVSAWVAPSAHQTAAEPGIIGKDYDSYLLTYYPTNGRVYWYINNGGGTNTSASVPTNAWSLVTATYDGSYLRLYVNGQASGTPTAYSGTVAYSASNLFMGCRSASGGVPTWPFKGYLDDVRVYNRALSSTDVSSLYSAAERSARDAMFANGAEDGKVAHYKMDVGSGTSLTDSSGFGNTGAIYGASWLNVGTDNYALDFDGVFNYVDCGRAPSISNITGPVTTIAWICPWANQFYNEPGIFGRGTDVFQTTLYSNNTLYWYITGSNNTQYGTNTAISTRTWSQIATTFDGSALKIYIDGVQQGTPTSYSGLIASSTNKLYLGCRVSTGTPECFFKGLIDEVKVYNYAMTSAEIASQYSSTEKTTRNEMFPNGGVDDGTKDSLVAHYTLSEGTGSSIADSSGHGNTGTLNNVTWTTRKTGVNAMLFDGTSSYVNCGSGSSLDIAGPMTMVAWMYPNSSQYVSEPAVVGKGFGSYLMTWYTGDYNSYFYIDAGGNNTNYYIPSAAWTQVTAVFDPYNSNTSLRMRMYINGVQRDTSSTLYDVIEEGGNLYIGCCDNGSGGRYKYFSGRVGDIRIYNRVLTDSDISDLYNP